MANHLRTDVVLDAIEMAVGQRRPREVIHPLASSEVVLPADVIASALVGVTDPRWLVLLLARSL